MNSCEFKQMSMNLIELDGTWKKEQKKAGAVIARLIFKYSIDDD